LGSAGPAAPALDHVQIAAPAGCEAAARRFYGEILGLAEIEKPYALSTRGGGVVRPERRLAAIAGGERLFTADPWGNRVELLASAQR
jgi:hypothetical protein